MTLRERVIAAIRHEQPDNTPYCIGFTQRAHAKMVDYYGDPNFADTLGNSMASYSALAGLSWREVRTDVWEDPFGVQWDRSADKDIGVVSNCCITPETLDEYVFPDLGLLEDRAMQEEFMRNHRDQFLIADLGFSLFERAWTLAGMENVLMAMVAEPEFAHALLDRILEFNLRVIDRACTFDVDAVYFGDDWGMQTGLLMGEERWREFIKPRIRQMYGAVKASGKYVVIHSCGKVDSVFPDLIECGLDVFNPFQPEVIDVFAAKQEYGNDLTFFGGISTQRTLPFGTPAQVREEVQRLLEVVGKHGGYIAAPAHSIPADAKPENIAAMIDVLQNQ